MTTIVHSPEAMITWRRSLPTGKSLGFVPTMGALHAGHADLIRRARAECDFVVVSIFVNPTQFNDPKDFQAYPLTWEADCSLCTELGVDAILYPRSESLYPDSYTYRVTELELSRQLEGASRPGHFDGVLSVVLKLLLMVMADRAYFGEKDWQQLQLVQGMVQAFFLPVRIVPVPTVREHDGLALSSRNVRLTPAGRALAAAFPKALRDSTSADEAKARLERAGIQVDYVVDLQGRRLGAILLDGVRLIDNWNLESGQ